MLVTNNGIFRPFALVKGRAVATWGFASGKVTIEHLGRVTKKAAAALEDDAAARRALPRLILRPARLRPAAAVGSGRRER